MTAADETTRELLREASLHIEDYLAQFGAQESEADRKESEGLFHRIRAALASAPPQGEAVAWACVDANGKTLASWLTKPDADEDAENWHLFSQSAKPITVVPLYPHPAPPRETRSEGEATSTPAEREARDRFVVAISGVIDARIACYLDPREIGSIDAKALVSAADGAEADWKRAILAAARERVEAKRYDGSAHYDNDDGQQAYEAGYEDAITFALAALTPTPEAT